jgi:hypothetical protein
MILPQPPTKSPKYRQKAANYLRMQVCALFWLKIQFRNSLKLNGLHRCIRGEGNLWTDARRRDNLQFGGLGHYHFCFVRVTGRRASIKEKRETVSD